jgi:hypothetical protein
MKSSGLVVYMRVRVQYARTNARAIRALKDGPLQDHHQLHASVPLSWSDIYAQEFVRDMSNP